MGDDEDVDLLFAVFYVYVLGGWCCITVHSVSADIQLSGPVESLCALLTTEAQ